jgi:hypothetical protein
MIVQEGFAQAELFNRFGMPLPDGEPKRIRGAVQINIRLKQLRALGVRRAERGQIVDALAWLFIYAESLSRRDGAVNERKIARDATSALIPFSRAELEEACTQAEYTLENDRDYSAWGVAQIGRALQITDGRAGHGPSPDRRFPSTGARDGRAGGQPL